MLAYLSWHTSAAQRDGHERTTTHLHHSLKARPPEGLQACAAFATDAGIEEWFVVEDWAALGVLSTALRSPGHTTAVADAVRERANVRAAVYRLLEGTPALQSVRLATWITPTPMADEELVAMLLADGARDGAASLWRRELDLGDLPELCLLSSEPLAGVSPARLPAGWTVDRQPRRTL